jgi:hypothetical protein
LVIGDITVHGSVEGSGALSDDTYDGDQRSKKGTIDGSSLCAVKCMIATAIREEDRDAAGSRLKLLACRFRL